MCEWGGGTRPHHYYRMRHWSMLKMAKNLSLFAARG